MKSKKILVSGASIAGPALAYWLTKYGFEVTVVERSASLRVGGQNIDVSGPGREVAEKMGIVQEILAANTGEAGVQFVDKNNRVKAAFAKSGEVSFTSELEILRGDLVKILYDHTKQKVDYRFGDYITGLDQQNENVSVTFSKGKPETFELVIAADGMRSSTRELMFYNEAKLDYLGIYIAYLTIPKKETDTSWARWYNATGSRVLILRPDNEGTTRASFAFLSKEKAYEKLPPGKQKELLISRLAHADWEAPRLTHEIEKSKDIYFDSISQIKAPRWHNGRFAMIGDAAYCPSPITGMGTTLAFTGAYILAGELSRHKDHEIAFSEYEKKMRPLVQSAQKLPPGVPWIVYPKTKTGIKILNAIFGIFASKIVQRIINIFKGKDDGSKKGEFVLPEYGDLNPGKPVK